ncbi:MAG: hypothetical protein J0L86_07845 [Flavobacteriales bacterium]|nr:hypothetical protein [Flavobacteriales bacterium]
MKKKLLIFVIVVIGIAASVYFYAYKDHKDIAASEADFTLTVQVLQKEFTENDSIATVKYQNKVVQVEGAITNVDAESKSIVIDDKIYAQFDSALPTNLEIKKKVTLKGRFLAYDDLVEEFKMDQSSIIE